MINRQGHSGWCIIKDQPDSLLMDFKNCSSYTEFADPELSVFVHYPFTALNTFHLSTEYQFLLFNFYDLAVDL